MKAITKYTTALFITYLLAASTAILAQENEFIGYTEIQIPQNCPTWVYDPEQKAPFLHKPRRCPIEGDILRVQEWTGEGNIRVCYKVVGVELSNVELMNTSSGYPRTFALSMEACPHSAWDFLTVDNGLQ